MRVSRERLLRDAQATDYRPEVLEKVFQLMGLLEGFNGHPYLKDRLALKGGTALNLFLFDLPRLSVDIDLNYIGATDADTMKAERPKVEQAIKAVCSREGMTVDRVPTDHAGGKWRLRYSGAMTPGGNLEVDLNYMFRMPLWPINRLDATVGSCSARDVPVLDLHELAAGKLAALFARHAGRDLFDAHHLLRETALDPTKLRLGFVLYGAMNRRDWRTVTLQDIRYDARELQSQLLPVLRNASLQGQVPDVWGNRLVGECRDALGIVLPLADHEIVFLDHLLEEGRIEPGLLTDDPDMADRIRAHPALQWKALNVKRHKGT